MLSFGPLCVDNACVQYMAIYLGKNEQWNGEWIGIYIDITKLYGNSDNFKKVLHII